MHKLLILVLLPTLLEAADKKSLVDLTGKITGSHCDDIATGAGYKKLGIPGEQKYWGKGVTISPVFLAWAAIYRDNALHELIADDSKDPLQLKPVTFSYKLEKIRSYGMAFKLEPEEMPSSIVYQNLFADSVTRYSRVQWACSELSKHLPGYKDVPFVHSDDWDVVNINTAGTAASAQNVHYSAAHEQTNSAVNPNLNLPLEERNKMFAVALQQIEDFNKQLKKEREEARKLAAATQTDK